MKIFSLLPTVDLSAPVKPSEFAFQEKFVAKGLPEIKYSVKYKPIPDMPIVHPDQVSNPAEQRNYKFVGDMRHGDQEFLDFAYRTSVARDQFRIVEARTEKERLLQKDSMGDQLDSETQVIQRRIALSWMQRIYMEKIFNHLRLASMDEFKRVMHQYHRDHDQSSKVQYKLFLRQSGDDPSQLPPVIEWNRKTGKDMEISRVKLDISQKELKILTDMRHRLAQQNAGIAFMASQTIIRNYNDWQKDLDAVKTFNELSGPGSKVKKIG